MEADKDRKLCRAPPKETRPWNLPPALHQPPHTFVRRHLLVRPVTKHLFIVPVKAEWSQVTTLSGMPTYMQVQVAAFAFQTPRSKGEQIIHWRDEYRNILPICNKQILHASINKLEQVIVSTDSGGEHKGKEKVADCQFQFFTIPPPLLLICLPPCFPHSPLIHLFPLSRHLSHP